MKVAISGGTGFIGKNLVMAHVMRGDSVKVLTRDRSKCFFPATVDIVEGDLCSNDTVLTELLAGVDVFYHCAAEIKNTSKMFEVNVLGTQKLLAAAKGNIRHWVQLSSTGVYGPVYNGTVKEDSAVSPNNEYEVSKLRADQLVVENSEKLGFTYSILRPSNVYGPDMSNKSLFQLIKTIDRGLFFFIGTDGANANYISVRNVVKALMLCGTDVRALNKVFIVSDSRPMKVFIKAISEALGKPCPKLTIPLSLVYILAWAAGKIPASPITINRVRALTSKVIYDTQFIESELGYSHEECMEDGILTLVQGYASNHRSVAV